MSRLNFVHKVGIVVFPLILLSAFLLPFFPSFAPYLKRPQLIQLYLTQPAMRDLMNLIAEDRLNSFPSVWDTNEGVLLSKKIYRPVALKEAIIFSHQPYSNVLFFQTGTRDFQRKYAALDSLKLRGILSRLETPFMAQASFDGLGFRRTGYDFNETCGQTVLFVGDSFTEGLWVKDSQTFASLFAARLNEGAAEKTCVANSGTNGYGIFEESAVAQDFHAKAKYHTLYLIHYPNDIAADGFAVLTGDLPDLEAAWEKHLSELAGLAAFAKAQHIRFVLVPLPPKEQFAMPESRARYQERLERFAKEHGIQFWDPYPFLTGYTWEDLYFDWDPHFSPSGHRIFAAFLWEKALTLPDVEL